MGACPPVGQAAAETLGRVWEAGAGPGDGSLTLDLDSTICEVSGKAKAGASYGYTNVVGYHPLVATRADTGEIVEVRLREGASQRGVVNFAQETIGRVRKAGASGHITIRADSGFWSYEMFKTLDGLEIGWSITTPQYNNVRKAIAEITDEVDPLWWTLEDLGPWSQEGVFRCRRRGNRMRRSSAGRWFAWSGLVARLVS